MKKSKKMVGAVATVTVFGVFTRLIGFIFKIYLSRSLGAEALGLYQIALSVFCLFASLSSSGVPLLLSRKTAECTALCEKERSFRLFSASLVICLTTSLTLTLVLALCGTHLSFLFSDVNAQPVFFVMLPALVSGSVYSVVRGWLWGNKHFTEFSATETIEEALHILFGVFFLSGIIGTLTGAMAIACAFTVSDIIVAVLLFALFFIKGGRLTRPAQIKEILIPSLPITSMRVCSGLIGTLIAFLLPLRLIAAGMSGAEATASYGRIAGMALPLLNAPNAVIGSLCIVLIPELSSSMVKNDFAKLNKQINLGINFSFLVSGLFLVVYAALGREITSLLYNDEISGMYLQVATFTMLPVCLSQLTQSALNSIGREYHAFVNYLIGNIAMLSVIYFLPKLLGIYSVAAASAISTSIISALNVISLRRATGIDLGFLKYALLVVVFTVPCFFLTDWLNAILAPYLGSLSFILPAIAGMAAYCALCMVTNVLDVRGIVLGRFKTNKNKGHTPSIASPH